MYIGKAAALAGTTIKSIRHYEQIGLLSPPARQGRYRIYDQASVDTLRFIKCAQQLGFRLNELHGILGGARQHGFPWELAQQAIERKKRELSRQIDRLQELHAGLEKFEQQLGQALEECPLARAG